MHAFKKLIITWAFNFESYLKLVNKSVIIIINEHLKDKLEKKTFFSIFHPINNDLTLFVIYKTVSVIVSSKIIF